MLYGSGGKRSEVPRRRLYILKSPPWVYLGCALTFEKYREEGFTFSKVLLGCRYVTSYVTSYVTPYVTPYPFTASRVPTGELGEGRGMVQEISTSI
jgi:hypothetical protein